MKLNIDINSQKETKFPQLNHANALNSYLYIFLLFFTGLKQKILDMLLSYNPLWLRIGLEVY